MVRSETCRRPWHYATVHARVRVVLLALPLKQPHWSVGWLIALLVGASAVAKYEKTMFIKFFHDDLSQVDGCEECKKAALTWQSVQSVPCTAAFFSSPLHFFVCLLFCFLTEFRGATVSYIGTPFIFTLKHFYLYICKGRLTISTRIKRYLMLLLLCRCLKNPIPTFRHFQME